MKKELVIAIFIGLFVGFGLAAIFWSRSQTSFPNFGFLKGQKQETQRITPVESAESTEERIEEIPLNIKHPENEIVHSNEDLKIIGETSPHATVVIIWEEGEDILVADEDGNFETEITLVGGENRIDISAYADDGTKKSQKLTVTYSTADF